MKTVHAFSFFFVLTFTALCQPLMVFGEASTDENGLTFTASEIHTHEVLLTWEGDFHSDDFEEFLLSSSVDGSTFAPIRKVKYDPKAKSFSLIVRNASEKDTYFQLAGTTSDGQTIPIKTVLLPAEKTGVAIAPLKSNHLVYITVTEACDIQIKKKSGEIVMELYLKKGMHPIDISAFDVDRYEVTSSDFKSPTVVKFERI